MNLEEAMKRIEELERKVRELEARPMQQIHYHYEQPQPQYWPVQPLPTIPWNPTYGMNTWIGGGGRQQ